MVDRLPRFFDIDLRLADLSSKGDYLERMKTLVDFELIRSALEAAVLRLIDRTKGGRPTVDHLLMFKVAILQAMHSQSDERAEYLIKDRLSFMHFLGLGLANLVPDANTIWKFREAFKRLFENSLNALKVMIQAADVDTISTWPDGRDFEEDHALSS